MRLNDMNEFDEWNKQKQDIQERKPIMPKEREIWWLLLGKNIGYEQNGSKENFLRPVLVFKFFNTKMFFGIPMTSGNKNEESWYYLKTVYNGKKYFFLLTQARLFSTKRLHQLIREVGEIEFKEVQKAFKKVMGI